MQEKFSRRDFLRLSAKTLLGLNLMACGGWGKNSGNVALACEGQPEMPQIEYEMMHFREHEVRPITEALVIHHAGFPNIDKDETARAIHDFHRNHNGWAGIGYHFLIRKDGTIQAGRYLELIGAHTYSYNDRSVGICLAGNFDIGEATYPQILSLKKLCAWLCAKYDIDPRRSTTILGHCDLSDTTCPGENFYPKLREIREYCCNVL